VNVRSWIKAAGALLVLAMAVPVGAQSTLSPQDIAARATRATVQIRSVDARGTVTGQGSGFFISRDGVLLSNVHVVEGAASLQIERDTGEVFDNVFYITSDARRDTVILKIPVSNAEPLTLGSDEDVSIGSRIYVMGNPLGQTATFSDGLVSARRMTEGVQMVQVTAPISPGSSGGPVMNDRGEVIGIATMYLEGGQNLNFVVPVRYVKPMLAMGEPPRRFSGSLLPVVSGGLASVGEGARPSDRSSGENDAPLTPDQQAISDSLTSQIKDIDKALRARGFTPSHDPSFGVLKATAREDITADMDAHTTYVAVAVCDNDCSDVDLGIAGPDGKVLQRDVRDKDTATVVFTPTSTDRYSIRVLMSACSQEPCYYSVVLYSKD
jgi:hypothetical protein